MKDVKIMIEKVSFNQINVKNLFHSLSYVLNLKKINYIEDEDLRDLRELVEELDIFSGILELEMRELSTKEVEALEDLKIKCLACIENRINKERQTD